MRKAPSISSAMVILAVFLCLGTAQVFAQCSLCVTAQDITCNGTYADCQSSRANCVSSAEFTIGAGCSGNYSLRAWVTCPGGDCLTCSACSWVMKENSTTVAGFVESACPAEDCDTQFNNIYLGAGTTYRLYVCLRPCDDATVCEQCQASCKANAALFYGVTTCSP